MMNLLRRHDAPTALEGLLVADFSTVLAGPSLTLLLQDLGATVVKVESPAGDGTRSWGPPWSDGAATYYQGLNRGKRAVCLDLTREDDRVEAVRLAARADVLVENLVPGRMERFGLGYDDVADVNPGIVYCSISGFGSQPGGRELPGYDILAQAISGLMSITGDEGGPGYKPGVALMDVICGLHGTVGVLAALEARARIGRGQRVEVDLLSSALAALANQASAYLMAGRVGRRMGNAHPSVVPYSSFPAADGELVIAVGTDRQFGFLCDALGLRGIAGDPRYATNASRVANRDELTRLISAATRSSSREELVERLRRAGVPCGPVNDVAEGFAFAEAIGLEAVVEAQGRRYVRPPVRLSETPLVPLGGAPELDADGDAVRAWLAAAAPGGPAAHRDRPVL